MGHFYLRVHMNLFPPGSSSDQTSSSSLRFNSPQADKPHTLFNDHTSSASLIQRIADSVRTTWPEVNSADINKIQLRAQQLLPCTYDSCRTWAEPIVQDHLEFLNILNTLSVKVTQLESTTNELVAIITSQSMFTSKASKIEATNQLKKHAPSLPYVIGVAEEFHASITTCKNRLRIALCVIAAVQDVSDLQDTQENLLIIRALDARRTLLAQCLQLSELGIARVKLIIQQLADKDAVIQQCLTVYVNI